MVSNLDAFLASLDVPVVLTATPAAVVPLATTLNKVKPFALRSVEMVRNSCWPAMMETTLTETDAVVLVRWKLAMSALEDLLHQETTVPKVFLELLLSLAVDKVTFGVKSS